MCIGPALWLVVDACRGRDAVGRGGARGRCASRCSTLGVSLWWIVGLRMQGTYGLPILQLTETRPDGCRRLLPHRHPPRHRQLVLLRQGPARATRSTRPSSYANNVGLQVVTFAIPVVALALGAITRWRHRAYFVLLRRRRRGRLDRRLALRRPEPLRRAVQVVRRRHRGRPGAAQHAARGAPPRARASPASSPPASPRWSPRSGSWWPPVAGGRARGRGPGAGADQRLPVAEPRPARVRAAVLEGRHRRDEPRGELDRGSSRSPAPTSPPTAGATPSSRSRPG